VESPIAGLEIDIDVPDIDIPLAPPAEVTGVLESLKNAFADINWDALKGMGPTMKIIFGWGQILSSFNLTFSIPWPENFDAILSGMYAPFNIDVFAIFGSFGCFVKTSYPAAFRMHMLMPLILLSVVMTAWAVAKVYRALACDKCCKPHYDDKILKARVLKNVNFILFVMYPGLGLRIFRVFATECFNPPDLQFPTVCAPEDYYMSSDLSVRVTDPEYMEMYTWAWFWMLVYVFGVPGIYIVVLYKFRNTIAHDPDDPNESVHPEHHTEVMAVRTEFGSMYKDYKRKYYYFEIIEMGRKISLVGGLVLLGRSGMQVFVGVIICFFYVLTAAYLEPLTSKTDQMLQYATSIQLFCTLITGLMLNYRAFERKEGLGDPNSDIFLEVWLMFSMFIVFGVILLVFVTILNVMRKKKASKKGDKETVEKGKTDEPSVGNESAKDTGKEGATKVPDSDVVKEATI
jgi:heme/copper-type cytochrome/quinol oxidase subunit 2